MKKVTRRAFFGTSLMAAAAMSVPETIPLGNAKPKIHKPEGYSAESPGIIDTNINLFDWPFRNLKYRDADSLTTKLRKHGVKQAWAGSFEALFHKDIQGVNARLSEACKTHGKNFLLPFGTVNLGWPDWEEDLRICDEVHHMPGIRIYPSYQTFDLDHPDFPRLVQLTTQRGMILQIVGDMDDSRNHHPIVLARGVNMEPLIEIAKRETNARLQLLYWNHRVNNKLLEKMVRETNIYFDTCRIETSGGIGRMIDGNPWSGPTLPFPVERLLFGSHAPYFPVEANILKLFESPLDLNQAKAIMEENVQTLIKHGK